MEETEKYSTNCNVLPAIVNSNEQRLFVYDIS